MRDKVNSHLLALSAVAVLVPWLLPMLGAALERRSGWLLLLPGTLLLIPLNGVVQSDGVVGHCVSLAATACLIGGTYVVSRRHDALLGAVALSVLCASLVFASALAR